MPRIYRQSAAALAGLAGFSLVATPAAALDLRVPAASVEPSIAAATVAEQHGWDRYDGYGYRHHRKRGPSAGDIIAGVAVIGAIAAIAGSSSKKSRERYDERDRRDYRTRDDARYREEDRRDGYDSGGISNAVDMCVDAVEQGRNEVENVDNASRGADGWRVSGALAGGAGWSCWIDNNGRVREIDTGGRYSGTAAREDVARNSGYFASAEAAGEGQPQWSDDAYARARAQRAAAPAPAVSEDGPRPSYPGGPVEGDEYPGGEWTGDGRYDTAEAGDFKQTI